jgi:peroxiredoxin
VAGDLTDLPADLPAPADDGAAGHLHGAALPSVPLPASDGGTVDLARLRGLTVVYAYPRTGRPGEPPLVPDWDAIPGARGCTAQSCAYRDSTVDLAAAGARVVGVSTQSPAEQAEAARRLQLPFVLLSDADLALATAMRLPCMEVGGQVLLRRLTLVVEDGVVVLVRYPLFPPDADAGAVLSWLRTHRP